MVEEFRPRFGRAFTVVAILIAATVVIAVAVTSGLGDAALTLPWMALFVACSWAIYWRPSVVVSDAGVRLVNVTRTIDLPWPAVEEVETRFALTLHTAYGRYAAWAAPAPGAGRALRISMGKRHIGLADRRVDDHSPSGEATARASSMGDLPGTASGDAAAVVRHRWERLRDAGFLDDPHLEFERAPTFWHWRVAAAIGGLFVLSVATLLLP